MNTITLSSATQTSSLKTKELQALRNERLQNLDTLKGFLVLLVIVGHAITGDMYHNFLKYSTTIFRMPLLIGISGYMLNYEKIKLYSISGLFRKYKTRLIIPWVLAVLFFTSLININKLHVFHSYMFGKILIQGFLFPFSHLWYIAGFLSWILIIWVLAKLQINLFSVVRVTALLSPFLILFHLGVLPVAHPAAKFIVYSVRPFYFFFFVLGIYLKSTPKIRHAATWHRHITVGLAAFLLLLYYFFDPFLYSLLSTVFNTLLLLLTIDRIKGEPFTPIPLLQWAGRNSLAIYLWHMLPLLILASVVGRNRPSLFYSLTLVSEIGLLYCIFALSKIKALRTLFFGLQG